MPNFILKALNEVVDETNRIQPANLKKINPAQVDVPDWKAVRMGDKEFNAANGTNINSGEDFAKPSKKKPSNYRLGSKRLNTKDER